MHSKRKGNIGQLAIAVLLSKFEYSVFLEAGDISKIDLIGEKDGKILTFQCKALTPIKGCLNVPLRKSGPNYCVKYEENQFDYFSVFDLNTEKVYLLSSKILRSHNNTFSLRVNSSKNTQKNKVNCAENYLAERVLQTLQNGIINVPPLGSSSLTNVSDC